MPETTICPACLTIGEVRSRPIAGTIWAIPAVLLCLLAGALLIYSIGALILALVIAMPAIGFAALSRWCFRRDLTCESCVARSLPVSTPGGQECWDRLKAKRKPTSRR